MLIRPTKTLTVLLLCVTATQLIACSNVGRAGSRVARVAYDESVSFDAKVRDLFDSENRTGENYRAKPPQEVYCYKTLGDAECYKHPLAGEETRLAGKQIPDPQFPTDSEPSPQAKPPIPMDVAATAPASGEVIYEMQESSMHDQYDIPKHRKPRELIPQQIEVKHLDNRYY